MSWGWRLPFLLSVVLIAIGLFIRLRVMESPVFEQSRRTRQVVDRAADRTAAAASE